MKRLIIMVIIMFIVLSYGTNAIAEDISQELEDNVEKYAESINFSDIEQYLNELEENSIFTNGFKAMVKEIISGNFRIGMSDFFSVLVKSVGKNIAYMLPIIASIIATGVLCSLSSNLASGFLKKSTMEIVYFVCYAIIIILVVAMLTKVSIMATQTVNNLTKVIEIIFPIMLTLVTTLGGGATVIIYQGSLAILSSLIASLLSKIIIPAFLAIIIFSIVGNMSKNVKLDKLANTFKTGSEWLMGISFGLYMIVLSFQGVGGAAYDGISIKAMKFMMSSYVPILGGYLSEGFDVIMASCILIKNAVGITAVILILTTIIYPIVHIIVLSLGLKLSAAILEPIADKRISDFLYLVSKSTTLLISAILGIGLILISSIMLLIMTCNGGVI